MIPSRLCGTIPQNPAFGAATLERREVSKVLRPKAFRQTPRVGFEPTTRRLTAGCSTAELSRNVHLLIKRNRRTDKGGAAISYSGRDPVGSKGSLRRNQHGRFHRRFRIHHPDSRQAIAGTVRMVHRLSDGESGSNKIGEADPARLSLRTLRRLPRDRRAVGPSGKADQ